MKKLHLPYIQRLERLEATLNGLPVQPIETRIHILERNFLASVKRKTKLNATLTGLQSQMRGSLVSLYRSLLDLSMNVEASRQEGGFHLDANPNSLIDGQGNSSLFQALESQLVALSTTVQQQSDLVDRVELLSSE